MNRMRSFGFLLKDATRLYTRRFEEHAESLSLTLQQCKALIYLEENEGVTQKRLAELIEVDPMCLVRILDRMEADGWVERRSDPDDRRARSLRLTEKGKPILEHVRGVISRTRAEAFRGLTEQERSVLIELMGRVHANLSALPPATAGAATTSARPGAPAPERSSS